MSYIDETFSEEIKQKIIHKDSSLDFEIIKIDILSILITR